MKCKLFFAWYDCWIGVYLDRKNNILYLALVPLLVLKISRTGGGSGSTEK